MIKIKHLKNLTPKIVLFFLLGLLFYSCSEVRKLQKKQLLIEDNEIIVNNKSTNSEDLHNQLYQKPNSKLLGFKPRLQLYNLSKKKPSIEDFFYSNTSRITLPVDPFGSVIFKKVDNVGAISIIG